MAGFNAVDAVILVVTLGGSVLAVKQIQTEGTSLNKLFYPEGGPHHNTTNTTNAPAGLNHNATNPTPPAQLSPNGKPLSRAPYPQRGSFDLNGNYLDDGNVYTVYPLATGAYELHQVGRYR